MYLSALCYDNSDLSNLLRKNRVQYFLLSEDCISESVDSIEEQMFRLRLGLFGDEWCGKAMLRNILSPKHIRFKQEFRGQVSEHET